MCNADSPTILRSVNELCTVDQGKYERRRGNRLKERWGARVYIPFFFLPFLLAGAGCGCELWGIAKGWAGRAEIWPRLPAR